MHRSPLAAFVALPVLLALPSLAEARPLSAGVSLGLAQSEADAANGVDASNTLGLFGRIGITQRVSAQLEVSRTDAEGDYYKVRKMTVLGVADLGTKGPLVPVLLAGFGVDDAEGQYDYEGEHGRHIEGGIGLEYRATGGITLGADLRIGHRELDQQTAIYADAPTDGGPLPVWPPPYPTGGLQAGEYRSGRVFVAVSF